MTKLQNDHCNDLLFSISKTNDHCNDLLFSVSKTNDSIVSGQFCFIYIFIAVGRSNYQEGRVGFLKKQFSPSNLQNYNYPQIKSLNMKKENDIHQ